MKCAIEGKDIVIRLPVDALGAIVEFAEFNETRDGENGEQKTLVTDADVFAKELILKMLSEDEAGNSPITRMIDACVEDAINDGAQGVTGEF